MSSTSHTAPAAATAETLNVTAIRREMVSGRNVSPGDHAARVPLRFAVGGVRENESAGR